ncbi:MAG: 4Fe-4S binding protein [Candidatus Goldbacteria bacterium]|nr:4Fe-4S binding protein [Candidatus Goldiibacteriota bacterium]
MEKKVEISEELCTGCGACVSMCPAQIIELNSSSNKAVVTDHESCDLLGGCMYVCRTGAIKVNRKLKFGSLFGF